MIEYGFAAEYGGKAFLDEYIKLKNKKIFCLDQLNEMNELIKNGTKKIFYICPGGELGQGKEAIREAIFHGHLVIGLVDHYTNFTHSTWNEDEDNPGSTPSEYWDRKLDYLFSSEPLTNGRTHQEKFMLSDHAPVSAMMEIR